MSKSTPLGRTLVLNVIVAVGVAAAWCVAVFWCIELVEGAIRSAASYEQLYVGVSGEPVIVRTTSGRYTEERSVTLAGEPSQLTRQDLLSPYWNVGPPTRRRLPRAPDWIWRLAGANDGGVPAVYWYLVHDGGIPGHAYGAGYHSKTKTLVGYFGRRGFTQTLPPREDWFAMNKGSEGLSIATNIYGGQEPMYLFAQPAIPMLADDKFWLIDLAQRQVRPIFDCPTPVAIGNVWKLPKQPPTPSEGIDRAQAQSTTPQHVFVRQAESVVVVDPRTGEHSTYPLPADLQKSMLAPYALADGGLLLLSAKTERDNIQDVVRLSPQGQETKRQQVRLANQTAIQSLTVVGWLAAAAGPFPLASAIASGLASWGMTEAGQAESYSAALRQWVSQTWSSMLVVIFVGIATATAAYRRQKRYGLPHAVGWAVFAFVFGVPGWLAYRFHRP